MLILTRRVGERLMIGDDITVVILGVKGNQVRIGIDAPKSTPIFREEVIDKMKLEKEMQYGTPAADDAGTLGV